MSSSQSLWTVYVAALLAPLAIAVFSPLPFAFFAPLIAVAALVAMKFTSGQWQRLDWPLYLWIGSFCALGALSSLWSVDPQGSLERALKIAALLLGALPLIDLARLCPPDIFSRWRLAFPLLVAVIGLAAALEIRLNFPVYRWLEHLPKDQLTNGSYLNKNAAAFTLLLPVALLLCHRARQYAVAALLLIAAGVLLITTESQSAQLALIVSLVAWLSVFILPVAGIPLGFAAVALLLVLMPWLAPIAFDTFADQLSHDAVMAAKASTSARLENWDFISRKIMTNPWTGFGMDTTRVIGDFQTEQLYFPSNRIMHPHNLALQLWIEFGVPGVVLALGFLGFLLRRLLALPVAARRLPFAVFCGALVFLLLSWSLWSAWLLALLIYLSALMVLAAKPTPVPETSSLPQ